MNYIKGFTVKQGWCISLFLDDMREKLFVIVCRNQAHFWHTGLFYVVNIVLYLFLPIFEKKTLCKRLLLFMVTIALQKMPLSKKDLLVRQKLA